MSTSEEEQFIGGFASANLAISGGVLGGYGVYATNKRIIGVNKNKMGLLRTVGALTAPIGLILIAASLDDTSAKTIAQLEEIKDFEVRKEEISEIEVSKRHGFTQGYLSIAKNSGESIKVIIGGFKEFENIRDLMKAFYPERLKIIAIKSILDLGQ